VYGARRVVCEWRGHAAWFLGAACEWKRDWNCKRNGQSITRVHKRVSTRRHLGCLLVSLCGNKGIPEALLRRVILTAGAGHIGAAQLHSSSNGGSLPHGGMEGVMAPVPPLGPDTPLDPDPLLDVDTLLDP